MQNIHTNRYNIRKIEMRALAHARNPLFQPCGANHHAARHAVLKWRMETCMVR